MITKREQILAEARSWAGVVFQACGNSREGIDCCHLVVKIGQACDLIPADFKLPIYNSPRLELFNEYVPMFFEPTDVPEPGDMILVGREPVRRDWTPPPRHMYVWGDQSHGYQTIIGVTETPVHGAFNPINRPIVMEQKYGIEFQTRHLASYIWKNL